MNVDNKLGIRLDVGGKTIQLTIDRDMEEMYRKAGTLINQKLRSYASIYPDREKEQIYCMTLIDIAVNYQYVSTQNDTEPYRVVLEQMASEIEGALRNTKD